MALFQQLSRSFGWLTVFSMPKAVYTHHNETQTSQDDVLFEQGTMAQPVQWIGNRLKLPRRLDASCYQEVLAAVQQLYPHGGPELVLDLSDIEKLELTGIFTLHCIALLMRGETTPDPSHGWRAMRAAAERNLAAGGLEHLKLVNPSARIEAQLRANHFDGCLMIESLSDPGQPLS